MDKAYDELVQPVLKFERFIGTFDYSQVRHCLSGSASQPLSLGEVLAMADDEDRRAWHGLILSYTESDGHPLLKREIAKLHEVDEEDVLVVCPQEGIFIAANTLVRYTKRKCDLPGTIHSICVWPAYRALSENLRLSGVDVSHWLAKFNVRDGWHFSLEELRSLIRPETKILMVNFPHNPTGATLSPDQWDELVQICRSNNIFLFSDEMYRFSEIDGTPPPASACALYEDAITLFGVSKTLALPGLRIGWLCTRNKEVMACLKSYKDFTSMCPPAPSEILAVIALHNIDKIIKRTMDIIQTNVKLWADLCAKNADIFDWKAPKAGPITLVRLRGWAAEFGSATAFCDKAMEECGLLLFPAAMFGGEDVCVRAGFSSAGLGAALEMFQVFIDKIRPSKSVAIV